ncbi:hypothetical protein [Sphingobium boeckii]|uniref:Uncharacterized protein n=1 Tax=Sphingobium boeckii TaxID=1082345 RepID=A0A7W9ECR7_9SPHN|nr:hypothetical protein [Sphingobium boeckii]MBB5684332.1 hypothetical protein [Sphingobium boeckii]
MLHDSPQNAGRPETASAAAALPRTGPRCPECLATFESVSPRQLFCSAAHKAAFHNRQTVRGRQLVPLVMAARLTRGGTRGNVVAGRKARRDGDFLMQRWADDDRREGRMSMIDYFALRDRKGFDTLLIR